MRNRGELLIMAINPGSTSTKMGIFRNEKQVLVEMTNHHSDRLEVPLHKSNQCESLRRSILEAANRSGMDLHELACVVTRGGFLRPLRSGIYRITKEMLRDLSEARYGLHASNLGPIVARSIADSVHARAFAVDPVVVDELADVARISGLPEIRRRSIFHALNHKAVASLAAQELRRPYGELNLIVAHLGGGITVGAHRCGRVIDVNDGLNGDGPFSPTRSGALPVVGVLELLVSKRFTPDALKERITAQGGVAAYLGTSNMEEVKRRVRCGDGKAKLIYEAMAYQVAKAIGGCATVLKGRVDAILISGGIARDKTFVDLIRERVSFLSRILVYPGERELERLVASALRALRGEEKVKDYRRRVRRDADAI